MSSTSEYENEWCETIVHWSLQDNPFFAQMPTVHIARAVRKLGEDEVTTPDTQCSRMFARVRNHRVDMNVMNGPDLLGQKGAIAQPHSYYDMLPFDNFIQTTGYTTMYAPDNWVPRSSSSYAKYRQLTKANISTDGYINAASRLVIGGEETLAFTEFALVQDEIKRTAAEVIYNNPELRHDPTIMAWINFVSGISYNETAGQWEFLQGSPLSKEDFIGFLLTDDGVNVNNLPNIVYPADWAVHDPFIPPVEFNLGMPRRNGAYDSTKPNSASNKPFIQRKITATHDMSKGEVFGVMLSERDVLVDNAT